MIIAGHRGASGHRPENTLGAFALALEQNAHMIELDIYLCSSGELVVIHDDRVNRTTNGDGLVEEMSLDELKKLDAGNGERIPTLAEVLDLISGKVPVNIELKGRGTAAGLSTFLDDYSPVFPWSEESLLVSSFDLPELLEFKGLKPRIRRGALNGGIPLSLGEFAKPLEPWSLHYNLEFINRKMVEDGHDRGYKIFVYTVDRLDDLARLRSWGVDGIFSNRPGDMMTS
jgi:glycerophosphoryl diester phosphodiesterase